MSSAVFPTFVGLKWSSKKTPGFSTKMQKSIGGKELRAAFYSYPEWSFELSYELLRDGQGFTELKDLVGFFLARQGSFDSFYYREPSDNSVTNQVFGVGDGVKSSFQLVRTYGGYVEPIFALNGSPSIYDNGSLVSPSLYTITNGVVTLTSGAYASGRTLTWTGQFYYVVRFKQDTLQFGQFLKDLWDAQRVELVSVKS